MTRNVMEPSKTVVDRRFRSTVFNHASTFT